MTVDTNLAELIKKKTKPKNEEKITYKDTIINCDQCEGLGAFFPNQHSLGEKCDFCEGSGKIRQVIFCYKQKSNNKYIQKLYNFLRKIFKNFKVRYESKNFIWR